eukprot:4623008-Lingulodinium_polyedra.AAC.1
MCIRSSSGGRARVVGFVDAQGLIVGYTRWAAFGLWADGPGCALCIGDRLVGSRYVSGWFVGGQFVDG